MIIGNVPMTVESAAPSPLAVPKSGPLWAAAGWAAAAARASRSAVSFAFSDSNSSCEKMPSSSSAFASRSPCKNAPSILLPFLPSLPSPPPSSSNDGAETKINQLQEEVCRAKAQLNQGKVVMLN